MKKAVYLRKSRGIIKDLDKHKSQLLSICEKNNWNYDLYEEIASSEKFQERKELSKFLDNIEKYDAVLCMHMDRLSRNELHQAMITKIFRDNDIKVITPSKIYDFNAENDILLGDFEKLIARQELRLTKARLRRGKISAFEKGYWVNGFPVMPYIYNKDTKMLCVDEHMLDIFMKMKTMALNGTSLNVIAQRLDMTPSKVRRTLSSKVPLGYTKYKGEYKKGLHIVVLTKEEYEKINYFISGNAIKKRKTKKIYKFSNLLVCRCGKRRTATKFNEKDAVLKCRNCGDKGFVIENFHIHIEEILKPYKCFIENKINLIELKNDDYKKLILDLEKVNLDIKKENKKIENVKKMMIDGILDIFEGKKNIFIYNDNLKYLENEKENIILKIKAEKKSKDNKTITLDEIKVILNNKILDSEINGLYKIFIDRIIVHKSKIDDIVLKKY